jgi:hypothetical protein
MEGKAGDIAERNMGWIPLDPRLTADFRKGARDRSKNLMELRQCFLLVVIGWPSRIGLPAELPFQKFD